MSSLSKVANPGASLSAIQFHYDIGNDFYHLWLDNTKTYTCALWGDATTLEQAQINKLDYHIDQARAADKAVVLDIGCGWGPALRRMVEHRNVGRAIGLTLSQAQADYVASLGDDRIRVKVESWSDHEPTEPYDAIISIGAFEHFARPDTSHEEKLDGYREFFERCRRWLKPGGYLSLQTITYQNSDRKDLNPFILKEIWPETDLPRLSDITIASDRKLEIVQARNDREDYVRTCQAWVHYIEENEDRAAALVGTDVVQRYKHWFKLSMIGFRTGTMGLFRITFKRST